jgi:hypothetical protein
VQVAVITNYGLSGSEDGCQAETRLLVKFKDFIAIDVDDQLQELTLIWELSY